MNTNQPLRDKIYRAKSESEINSLLAVGMTGYKNATDRTKNRWRSAANQRLAELKFAKVER